MQGGTEPELKVQYHNFLRKYEELGHRDPVNSQEGRRHVIFYHIIQSSRKTALQQELRLHLVEMPRFLMALNNANNESYPWTDSTILLTGIQGPPNRWKTFVGNGVAIIQEETASATWRHVPSQSNPADLISRGDEPATLSTSTLW